MSQKQFQLADVSLGRGGVASLDAAAKSPVVPAVPMVPAVPVVPAVPAVPMVPAVSAAPAVPAVPAVPAAPVRKKPHSRSAHDRSARGRTVHGRTVKATRKAEVATVRVTAGFRAQPNARTRTASRREERTSRDRAARERQQPKSPRDLATGAVERVQVLTASAVGSRAILALAIITAIVFSVFGPIRDYYVAVRTQQDLAAYYAALEDSNDNLKDDISRLQSKEGIEDEARRRGYVMEGETSVVVRGLDADATGEIFSTQNSAQTAATKASAEEEPWYTQVLDFLFGYKEEAR